ncbi:MAG TPA: hypothetical protein VIZ22_10530 [Candidatus Limnocylindrales bacterium]
MRIKLVTPILLIALVAACGGGGTASTTKPAATNAEAPADTAAPAGNGSVDCVKVKAAATKLIVAVQLLAQLRDPANVEAVKSGTVGNLDLDEFLAALKDLHALDGQSSVLGDPKTAIEAYEKAGEAAKVLFATNPVTQDAVDTYNTNVGTVPAFLGHQGAIAGAMDAAGC